MVPKVFEPLKFYCIYCNFKFLVQKKKEKSKSINNNNDYVKIRSTLSIDLSGWLVVLGSTAL